MSGWVIFGVVLLILFLLGQVRAGAGVEYSRTGFLVRARLGLFRLTVFPRPRKDKVEKKKKPPKKKKEKPREDAPKPKGGTLGLARELLPLALEAAGCFKRKLVVDRLELRVTAGASDPSDAAFAYGQANAALGALWRHLTESFHVKSGRAHVEVDFDQTSITLNALAELSLKIWQVLWLGLYFGVRTLVKFIRYRRQQKIKQERKAV